MRTLNLKYIATLKSYTTESLNDRYIIKSINRELFSGDFWKSGSMYVAECDLDLFIAEAYKSFNNINVY